MALISLWKKELREISFSGLALLLLSAAFYVFLYYQARPGTIQIILGVIYLPFIIYPLFLLFQGYRTFSREWREKTIFLLKSLPRSGYEIVLAKSLAAAVVLIILMAASSTGIYLIISHNFTAVSQVLPPEFAALNWGAVLGWGLAVYFWLCGFAYFTAQLSSLTSRFFNRFRWLVTLLVFYLVNYLTFRLAGYLGWLFDWLPDVQHFVIRQTEEAAGLIEVSGGGLAAAALILLIMFVVSSLLLERTLEV